MLITNWRCSINFVNEYSWIGIVTQITYLIHLPCSEFLWVYNLVCHKCNASRILRFGLQMTELWPKHEACWCRILLARFWLSAWLEVGNGGSGLGLVDGHCLDTGRGAQASAVKRRWRGGEAEISRGCGCTKGLSIINKNSALLLREEKKFVCGEIERRKL